MDPLSWTAICGGLPFVHDAFNANALFTAVAAVRQYRHQEAGGTPRLLEAYVNDPSFAYQVSRAWMDPHGPIEAHSLLSTQQARFDRALAQVAEVCPEWSPLLGLPVTCGLLVSPAAISLTNPGIPQHAFFGPAAFSGSVDLADLVVHEWAHLWLAMGAELRPLHDSADPARFTLPSGSPGKHATGVLMAAHFAAASTRYHRRCGDQAFARERLAYLRGCLQTLDSHPLTPSGAEVFGELAAFAEAQQW